MEPDRKPRHKLPQNVGPSDNKTHRNRLRIGIAGQTAIIRHTLKTKILPKARAADPKTIFSVDLIPKRYPIKFPPPLHVTSSPVNNQNQ
jgi:pantothenate kinase